MSRLTEEDEKKVVEYRKTLGKYPKPSVTADIVAVRPWYSELGEDEWRENPKFGLQVLLIKRGVWPYEGAWALPGGFIKETESVEQGAVRELKEETSLRANTLIPVGIFSDPGRDIRAWVMSNAFVSIHKRGEGDRIKGGDDAREAKWLTLKWPTMGDGRFNLRFYDGDEEVFSIVGKYREEEFFGGTVTSVDPNPLAFDHGRIIAQAFLRMLSCDKKKLTFFFLPEKFTLANYMDIYQYLTRTEIPRTNIPNFRRRLTETENPLLEVCEGEKEDLAGRAHAPAKLYRRKV